MALRVGAKTEGTAQLTSLDNHRDLRHRNKFVVGLALTALGNIASTDITRDLASEVRSSWSSMTPT